MKKRLEANTNNHHKTRICILGGGFGGLYTALKLARFKKIKPETYQIILIDQRDHILFTPLLYELITDELRDWEITPSFKKLLQNNEIIQFLQDKITHVDLSAQQITLQNQGCLIYDYLVIAVGQKSRVEDIPGLPENALRFRTLADTHRLKQRLQILENSASDLIRVSIVGGGPSGVELAVKIADRLGKQGAVNLITKGNQILRHFTPATRNSAIQALDRRGIRVILNTQVETITSDHVVLQQRHQSFTLGTDLTLWTTGTEVRDWIKTLDCSHNKHQQIVVQPSLQLSNYPEVFALGDVAEIVDKKGNKVPLMAQAAYQQAHFLSHNLHRALNYKKLKKFRYFPLGEMMTLGIGNSAITSFGFHLHGRLAHLIRYLVYLQRMPTFSHRFKVLLNWIKESFKPSKSIKKPTKILQRTSL